MKLIVCRMDPVQEIAAEKGTLDALINCLRPLAETAQQPFGGAIGSLTGLPLIADPRVPVGFIHMRPVNPQNTHDTTTEGHPDA